MIRAHENQENISIYEIENKKYTVVTRCVEENVQNIDKLYDVLCELVLSQMNLPTDQ